MKKKKMILGIIIMLGVVLLPIQSKAVLQANPNTSTSNKSEHASWWLLNIRNMETKNQAMGLEETIDGTTKKATSPSNGIDVHMIKNTEWGSVAILSASGYGNSKKIHESAIKTTTGNKTGVYFLTAEVTAGFKEKFFSGLDERYYNSYTYDKSSAKIGDAMGESTNKNPGCWGWHESQIYWIDGEGNIFIRNSGNKIFGLYRVGTDIYSTRNSRAAVVCGDGF